jgi:hypothetical protein
MRVLRNIQAKPPLKTVATTRVDGESTTVPALGLPPLLRSNNLDARQSAALLSRAHSLLEVTREIEYRTVAAVRDAFEFKCEAQRSIERSRRAISRSRS